MKPETRKSLEDILATLRVARRVSYGRATAALLDAAIEHLVQIVQIVESK